MVLTLADELLAQGYRCELVCFKRFQELSARQTLRIHHFPLQWLRWLPRAIRGQVLAPFLDLFIRQRCGQTQLILSNLLPADRILAHSRLKNVHLVVHNTLSQEFLTQANLEKQPQILTMLQRIYGKKPCICVSQGVLDDLKALLPKQQQAVCIYNPVDAKFVKQLALEPNPLPINNYLIHVGKFKLAKRHDRLLRAYAASEVSTPLVLVGQGELLEDMRGLAQQLGISERVMFAGFHSNPYPLIAAAKGLVLSSDYEGLGLVILEALALNVAVISTDCSSGPREILPSANLVALDDIAAFAQKICELDHQPDAFRVTLHEQFSPSFAAQQYLAQLSSAS